MLEPAEEAAEVKRSIVIVLLAIAVLAMGAVIASPDSSNTPPPTMAQLKAKIKQQANRIADLNDDIDARDATIDRLRARDPLDAVTARNPDGLWDAMRAIYAAFPSLPPGEFCGYDKSFIPSGGLGLVATSYTFYNWSGC